MPINPNTNTALRPTDQDKKNQTRGSGFTNINRILDANKGAGERMGGAIGGQLTNQANSVREGIQSAQNQFGQQKAQAAGQAQGAVQAGTNLVKQAGENDDAYASRVSSANQDFSKIGQNLRAAEYTGPMQLDNAGKLQAQASNASSLGRLAGTTTGQQQLLGSMVAKPGQYNRGQSALDALLVGQQGQNAIQQGRRSTAGLQDKAIGAAQLAENQANALKGGIASSRDKALTDLRNAVVGEGGFREQAAKQAQTFQTDASDLSKVLSGQYGGNSPEEKARAQELINRMGDFGLQDYSLYNEDPNAVKNTLSQLGGTLTQDFGARKYTDQQKQASQNLASVLDDKQLQDELNKSKFNTDVFGDEAQIFTGLDQERTKDIGNRDMLAGAAKDFRNYEDTQNVFKQMFSLSPDIYAPVSPEEQQRRDAQRASAVTQLQQMQQAGTYTDQNALLGKYGYGAWADVNPDTDFRLPVDNKWAGLGLAPSGPGGTMRSSASLQTAADKQVAQDAQMKDFILKQMLGIQ